MVYCMWSKTKQNINNNKAIVESRLRPAVKPHAAGHQPMTVPRMSSLPTPTQFAVTVYNDKAKQRGATWRIRWKFMTTYFSTALTYILPMRHAIGSIMGKHDVIHKTGSA